MTVVARLAPLFCVVLAVLGCRLDPVTQGTALVAALLAWAACAVGSAWSLRSQPTAPWAVWAVAGALHVAWWTAPVSLSDDVWRYLWEGRVQLAGFSPFLHPPDDPALEPLRDAIWERVNHRSVSTIYPPLAQALFVVVAAVAPSALTWKVLAGLAMVGCAASVARLARARGVGAWAPTLVLLHPLPVVESSGSGHLDALALLGLLAGLVAADRGRPGGATALLVAGALVKVLPLAALATVLRGVDRRRMALLLLLTTAAGVLAALPFVSDGAAVGRGAGTFYRSWAYNGGLFPLLEAWLGERARPVGVAVGATVCAAAWWRERDPAVVMTWVGGALVLLSPVVHPWYVLWVFLPAAACGSWAWTWLASTCLATYLVLSTYDPTASTWTEPTWVRWIEYPPTLAALVLAWWWGRRRPR